MTAAETYVSLIEAVHAQRARIHGQQPNEDRWGGSTAQRFRQDPHRPLDDNLEIVASFVQPDDVVVDVGGGAGRVCLPLALRCREVINVDPSPGMRAEFEACATEAGIANARFVQKDWLAAEGIQGDIAIVAHVTYFVRAIVPFVEKLEAAARRRVLVLVMSVPPPNQGAELFRLVYGEEQTLVPGHRELVPLLWEIGILPDVRVLSGSVSPLRLEQLPQTRDEAVEYVLQGQGLRPEDHGRARAVIGAHFSELFAPSPEGFRPRWRQRTCDLLITWETGRRSS